MKANKIAGDAELLLQQMLFDAEDVIDALEPGERALLQAALGALAEEADQIKDKAELLALAGAVHMLVEELPGLRALLLPEEIDVAEARAQRTRAYRAFEAGETDEDPELAEAQARLPAVGNTVKRLHEEMARHLAPAELPPADPGRLRRLLQAMGIGRNARQ